MITTNAFCRVFHVRYNDATGTAFTVDREGKQYLVSARHVFEGIGQSEMIEVEQGGSWKTLEVNLIGVPSSSADVIVLSPSLRLSPAYPLPIVKSDMTLGQEVYFLGFPFNLYTEVGAINQNFPVPLIKRACLSGSLGNNGEDRIWLLDGINNPGFSGGPVLFRKLGENMNGELMVMGIISGYRFQEEPIYANGKPLPINAKSNTGIIYAFDAEIAINIIDSNPNGLII
jgi:S1-C subfamily serine protease